MSDGIAQIGKALIAVGILLVLIGGALLASGKIPWVGRLPGDILIERKNFTFYFPLATGIVLSLLLTLLFWLLGKK